jgi:hypothetical protein
VGWGGRVGQGMIGRAVCYQSRVFQHVTERRTTISEEIGNVLMKHNTNPRCLARGGTHATAVRIWQLTALAAKWQYGFDHSRNLVTGTVSFTWCTSVTQRHAELHPTSDGPSAKPPREPQIPQCHYLPSATV